MRQGHSRYQTLVFARYTSLRSRAGHECSPKDAAAYHTSHQKCVSVPICYLPTPDSRVTAEHRQSLCRGAHRCLGNWCYSLHNGRWECVRPSAAKSVVISHTISKILPGMSQRHAATSSAVTFQAHSSMTLHGTEYLRLLFVCRPLRCLFLAGSRTLE
jgi:hypothetical protein